MSTVDVPESQPLEEAAVSEPSTSSDRTERFRAGIAERCAEPPTRQESSEVWSFRFFASS